VLLGTVAYLSPEQVERGIADARSDVYAAGLILFEMLTGTKAFTGDTPIHIAYQHVHGSIPAPSSRVSSVPSELDALVALATSRDPDQRPHDAEDVLAEVRKSRAMLTPTELDRRPEGPAALAGGASTVAVERTSALPVHEPRHVGQGGRALPPVALPIDRTPTTPPVLHGRVVDAYDDDRRGPWRWIGLALAVALVAGVAAWWFLAGPGSPTVVPQTTRLTFAQAQAKLTSAHLGADQVESFDESVPKGIVMSTDPGAGQEVRRGTDVKVTVSKGPERYAVPNVVNKSAAEARDQITTAKLVVGTSKEAFDEKVAAGLVVSVDPKVGTSLKRGSKVNLVISKGRQPIAVTDFTNKPAAEAVDALSKAGLTVDATEQANSDTVPKGNVISQSPAGGNLYKGDTVKLVVSKGPVMVKVPDVSGTQADEAEQILRTAGFDVKREKALGGIVGTVHHTNPAAGTEAPKGSVVTMVII
jgi:serine/threonine-protein kinase